MTTIFESFYCILRRFLFSILAFGPMPNHIAFIMDGNRRYANRRMEQGTGHRAGFSALISVLRYCYEMGVKYVTIYAFSIENFKRKPEEVQSTMNLMKEKIDELMQKQSIVSEYGVRVNFLGNLNLLENDVRLSIEKFMRSTSNNTGPVLSICVAYTSTDEITHAIEKSCCEKKHLILQKNPNGFQNVLTGDVVSVDDLESYLYTASCPDPDIIIRTSGETRLSNFLLWQSSFTQLQSPAHLWPEFSLRHLAWAILQYQRAFSYLEKIKKSKHVTTMDSIKKRQ
ncbi:hypothetical protein HPP92_013737 [Vanilla planifolia]|uniref:Alkyl transferase n=1 Tax=Vanilla planifolia TaxID=51239 RepID=A0A835UZ50_VANPL|nr:hypothetical protein HPP92_026458 [Vanilla planifolia]KAG0479018.1 hypothetical protein HPP92_013737 [Vanilla planifolia]